MPLLRFFFLPEGRRFPDLAPELFLAVLLLAELLLAVLREPEGREPEEDLFPEPDRPDSRGI